jgi:hypothetical protein
MEVHSSGREILKGMDSLLNSPSTAAWALIPIALGILGLGAWVNRPGGG